MDQTTIGSSLTAVAGAWVVEEDIGLTSGKLMVGCKYLPVLLLTSLIYIFFSPQFFASPILIPCSCAVFGTRSLRGAPFLFQTSMWRLPSNVYIDALRLIRLIYCMGG